LSLLDEVPDLLDDCLLVFGKLPVSNCIQAALGARQALIDGAIELALLVGG
jgi:hypothetical protein